MISEFGCCSNDENIARTSDDDLCCATSEFGCCSDDYTPKMAAAD